LFVYNKRQLYVCGNNSNCQLGVGSETPDTIEALTENTTRVVKEMG
jgi:hypothetical protein